MIKEFKKVIYFVLIMITVLTLFGTVAFADQSGTTTIDEKLMDEINKTNDFIFKEIDKANREADKAVSKFNSKMQDELRNMDKLDDIKDLNKRQDEQFKIQQKIEKLQRDLDRDIDKICEKLVEKTEKEAENLIKKAAAKGVVIIKEYIEVTIYNRTILVDPCCAH